MRVERFVAHILQVCSEVVTRVYTKPSGNTFNGFLTLYRVCTMHLHTMGQCLRKPVCYGKSRFLQLVTVMYTSLHRRIRLFIELGDVWPRSIWIQTACKLSAVNTEAGANKAVSTPKLIKEQ